MTKTLESKINNESQESINLFEEFECDKGIALLGFDKITVTQSQLSKFKLMAERYANGEIDDEKLSSLLDTTIKAENLKDASGIRHIVFHHAQNLEEEKSAIDLEKEFPSSFIRSLGYNLVKPMMGHIKVSQENFEGLKKIVDEFLAEEINPDNHFQNQNVMNEKVKTFAEETMNVSKESNPFLYDAITSIVGSYAIDKRLEKAEGVEGTRKSVSTAVKKIQSDSSE